MTTRFRKALPDGPAMPIRKRRTDCPSPIAPPLLRPASDTVKRSTAQIGPSYRTSQVLPRLPGPPRTGPCGIATGATGNTQSNSLPATSDHRQNRPPKGPARRRAARTFYCPVIKDGPTSRRTLAVRIGPREGPPSGPGRWGDSLKSHRRHTPTSGLWDPGWNCVREMLSLPAGDAAIRREPRNRLDVP